ncbi:MAG: TetR/AcrR family transcriptional regulator [Azospirillaceae bacterium]|nr:TetR/AcrR family transcriptional regulator [Azospirillaceae bacterium]
MSRDPQPVRENLHGQALGRKGAETRQRLMDATRALLRQQGPVGLTALQIAKQAGTSGPTFYLYFGDTEDVLLALSEAACQDTDDVVASLSGPWPENTLPQHCRDFIDAFYRYWNRHREVLNFRNFRSDLGDERFDLVRQRSAIPIVHAISRRVQAAQAAGTMDSRTAMARSVIIYAAIERLATRIASGRFLTDDINAEDLYRAEADILVMLFSRHSPP